MSSFASNGHFPPTIGYTSSDVTSDERSTAIDFVNRHNFIFEEFDHTKMLATFLPDAVVYHSHGTVRGHAEMKVFFKEKYGFFIPGIGRSATNHIVDRDESGGVIVKFQECLIRHSLVGEQNDPHDIKSADVTRDDGLPAIWWFATVTDRLRMTNEGWKIFERYLGTPFRNKALDPAGVL
jgi:hypothetical protein